MALEAEHRISGTHPAAVVDDLDQCPARIGHNDRHLPGTGVHGVFHQFLDDGRRTLHNFSGGDHVGDLRREDLEPAHYRSE